MSVENETASRMSDRPGHRAAWGGRMTRRFLDVAKRTYPHLQEAGGSGIFLPSGGRLYVDSGDHLEYSCPECEDPTTLVRFKAAGELMLSQLCDVLKREDSRLSTVGLARSSVDYTTGHTWGSCHENYEYNGPVVELGREMIPFLVSRVVITGAGGFDPDRPLAFTLSPRATRIDEASSSSSTERRGIWCTKREELSSTGSKRIQVLCGGDNCSRRVTWIKMSSAALCLLLSEHGTNPWRQVALAAPVKALRTYVGDVGLKATAETSRGLQVSALQVQRAYLEAVEARLGESWMPGWAEDAVGWWRWALEALESGDTDVLAAVLDWPAKYKIMGGHAQSLGFSWDDVRCWSRALEYLRARRGERRRGKGDDDTDVDGGPDDCRAIVREARRGDADRAEVILAERGQSLRRLEEFMHLRSSLFLLDWQLCELGPSGLWAQLRGRGLIHDEVEGLGDIEEAITTPPPTGRASVRGRYVRKLAGKDRYAASWVGIWDVKKRRVRDISDPHQTKAGPWREAGEEGPLLSGIGMGADLLALMREHMAMRRCRATHGLPPPLFSVGDRVILGRHDPVEGDANWNSLMDQYVGTEATVTDVGGADRSGCRVVRVDVDGGRWAWRERNLSAAEPEVPF